MRTYQSHNYVWEVSENLVILVCIFRLQNECITYFELYFFERKIYLKNELSISTERFYKVAWLEQKSE